MSSRRHSAISDRRMTPFSAHVCARTERNAKARSLVSGQFWDRLSWQQTRMFLLGAKKDTACILYLLPEVLVLRILSFAHNPRWRPTFTRALPKDSVTAGGTKHSFRCRTFEVFEPSPYVEIDGTGTQYIELDLSFIDLGSEVEFYRPDGSEVISIRFNAEKYWQTDHYADETVTIIFFDEPTADPPGAKWPDNEIYEEGVKQHRTFGANGNEWSFRVPLPKTGRVAHRAHMSSWSLWWNEHKASVTLGMLFDFDHGTVRFGLRARSTRPPVSHFTQGLSGVCNHFYPEWRAGPLVPFPHGPVRMGLSGFFGEDKEKEVAADGAIRLVRVSASISTPQAVPAALICVEANSWLGNRHLYEQYSYPQSHRTQPPSLLTGNAWTFLPAGFGVCKGGMQGVEAGCLTCAHGAHEEGGNYHDEILDEYDDLGGEEIDGRWSCDVKGPTCCRPSIPEVFPGDPSFNPEPPRPYDLWVCLHRRCGFVQCAACHAVGPPRSLVAKGHVHSLTRVRMEPDGMKVMRE